MKITENLELEQIDIERILVAYLKSYRYYNKGKTPEKIILPKLTEVKIQVETIPPEFATIPVVYSGEEKLSATSRPLGAKRDYRVVKAVSPSSSDESKSDK